MRYSGFGLLLLAVATSVHAAVTPPSFVEPTPITAQELRDGFRHRRVVAMPHETAAVRSLAEIEAAESRAGLRLQRRIERMGGLRLVELPAGRDVRSVIAELEATGLYRFVEPDYIVRRAVLPNDPEFGEQWALENLGQDGGTPGADISAPEAWDLQTDAAGVIVAVLDTGARTTHLDLRPNLWRNPGESGAGRENNATDDDRNGFIDDVHGANFLVPRGMMGSGNVEDDDGHGTHVAGTIGAVGNNALGIAGVAWKVQIMPLKFLDSRGFGTVSGLVQATDYAIAHGAHIINASYGSDFFSQAEFEAVQRARAAGVVIVAAAGNSARNLERIPAYPAAFALDNIVTVAATDRNDELADFSNFGAGYVDLAAPGVAILSLGIDDDEALATLSGTSMAAPHVTGALALVRARYPAENYRQHINRVLNGVDRLPDLAGVVQTGGRLNLRGALSTASARPPNDDFANRAVLAGERVRARTAIAGATIETGEPLHAGVPTAATLWYSWEAPEDGRVYVDTIGTTFDSVLAIYTGTDLASLLPVASNDDESGHNTARLAFEAAAGTTYQIAVGAKAAATGMVQLEIGPFPYNTSFGSAITQTGESWVVQATNTSASSEGGEPFHAGVRPNASLWYRWVAPSTRTYFVTADSVTADTVVAVYTGKSLSGLGPVASNDDARAGRRGSVAKFHATAGTEYFIAIDTKASRGDVRLALVDADWVYMATDAVTAAPAVARDGAVLVASRDGRLHSLAPDGAVRWTQSVGAVADGVGPAVASDGTVYLGAVNGGLYAYTAQGALKWRYATTDVIATSPAIGADGTVFVATAAGQLLAVSPAGSLLWQTTVGRPTAAAPVVAPDGTVYLGTDEARLHAIAPGGAVQWSHALAGAVLSSPALLADGTIVFAVDNQEVVAIRPDGSFGWAFGAGAPIDVAPVVGTDGRIYVGAADGQLHALSPVNGVPVWSLQLGAGIGGGGAAIDSDGNILLGTDDGLLHVVRPDSTLLRVYAAPDVLRTAPALAGGRLVYAARNGTVHSVPYARGAAASSWPLHRGNAQRTGRTLDVPQIVAHPASVTVPAGTVVELSVAVVGEGPFSFQWQRDGVAIPGATGASLVFGSVSASDAGGYSVQVSNGGGTVTSAVAFLGVDGVAGRLVNLSTRAPVEAGDRVLIAGFVIHGLAPKPLLLRGVGPGLRHHNVTGFMPNPRIGLFDVAGVPIAANDNWGAVNNPVALLAATSEVGAFALPFGSTDAALFVTLSPGAYTLQVSGDAPGVALAEVYDAGKTGASRLVNLSTRGYVATGQSVMIPGFTLVDGERTLLVRGIGPTLAQFGLPADGLLPNPVLEVFDVDGQRIALNDDWGQAVDADQIALAAAKAGAFALHPTSKDAALVLTLGPGSYTFVVRDAAGGAGLALVEVYVVP